MSCILGTPPSKDSKCNPLRARAMSSILHKKILVQKNAEEYSPLQENSATYLNKESETKLSKTSDIESVNPDKLNIQPEDSNTHLVQDKLHGFSTKPRIQFIRFVSV